jgi:hypothetical protein
MPSTNLDLLTQETMEIVKKAQTAGLYYSTGVQGVDLGPYTSLVPVNVPARNNTSAFPRVIAGEGSQVALWRTWLNVNSSQPAPAIGPDYAGALALLREQDVYAKYVPLAYAGRVTMDAIAIARNYTDALAQAELQTLNQLFIGQDIAIINGQAWALPSMGTVALSAGSGGSIAASTAVYVSVAPRSGANYYWGGSGPASSAVTITTGTTGNNAVTATWAAVKGAVAYDVYVGSSATSMYYYTTTTLGTVTITSIPTSAQPIPNLPLISQLAPGAGVNPLAQPPVAGNGTPPTTDTSYSASNYYNGVIASTLGDYGALGAVTPGQGTPSGAVFIDNGGQALQLQGSGINVLDNINEAIWNNVQLSPTAYMVNSYQAQEISELILSTSAALTFLPPTDADARTNLAGGGYIGRYINRAAGGVPVMIEVHPHVPPGTIIARTDRVPFPGSNIGTVYEVRCQYDTMRFDYAANYQPGTLGGGPRYDFEIRSMETLVNRAPVAQAVVTNVA